MNDKKVCKYCSKLSFYDFYYCQENNQSNKNDLYIEDIENESCDKFEIRPYKFWNYENSDF